MKHTSTALIAVALVGAAVAFSASRPEPATLPVYRTADLTPEWVDLDAAPAHRVGAFALQDQSGATITEADLDGAVTVVSFFFARCTSICPSLRSNLTRVQEAFANDGRVQILSHTVQPEADSVSALRAYAATNHIDPARWHLLTGSRDAIYGLARASYFADVAEDGFLHTETVFLLDGQRRIRGVYTGSLPLEVDRLIEDARTLSAEQS